MSKFSRMSKAILLKFISVIFLLNIITTTKLKAESSSELHSILFLIDISGSMKGERMDSVKSATKRIITMLLPCNNEFSIMGYSGKSENPIPFQLSFTTDKQRLFSFIDSLQPNSNTPLGAALKTASFFFKNNKSPNSVKQTIILLGDGRSDDNIADALKDLKDKNSLIQCECIGFCLQYDKQAEQQLRQIASETNGEYYSATESSNVMKAFMKTSIKATISDIPVEVRATNKLDFKSIKNFNFHTITKQSWVVDSIQINVRPELFSTAQMITDENIQDTLPKSIVFETNRIVSLYINNGAKGNENQKWVEGKFLIENNMLTLNLPEHYIKLIIKKIDNKSMVLCVNKYKSYVNSMIEYGEICDCRNNLEPGKPTILVYFSTPGCN